MACAFPSPELSVDGDGPSQVSFLRQAHTHGGWGDLSDDHVEAAHPICSFLWEDHTRLVGYYHHLNPDNPKVERSIEVYRRMGAIPTMVTNDLDHLWTPGEPMKWILELAKEETRRRAKAGD